ncbi:hypothetical protein MON38_07560 [Hymenobacter sp. DH14]|uniref:Outer membrane protein beta-barrel domain-containing protein n=1 Tax=Hymenobacter cyanobacteriorum TaxID=2926463 RepID=A0A9X1VES0_9BACT|nr:hypothetical protein [Hymenobacter cyanobacteriorum]MCI1187273.1 hypothetical protein [Hymenobacter cyanobacteriorum]
MASHYHFLPALLLSLTVQAQSAPGAPPAASSSWQMGLGVGNGLEMHGGYRAQRWVSYARVRGKIWGPDAEPRAHLFGDDINAYSQQFEVAAGLVGYPLKAGKSIVIVAAGLAYVNGRQLGEYRYSLRKSGLFTSDATHYYAYRDYAALGLPLELAWQAPEFAHSSVRLGLTGQANLNPQHSVYCLLSTVQFDLARWSAAGR